MPTKNANYLCSIDQIVIESLSFLKEICSMDPLNPCEKLQFCKFMFGLACFIRTVYDERNNKNGISSMSDSQGYPLYLGLIK